MLNPRLGAFYPGTIALALVLFLPAGLGAEPDNNDLDTARAEYKNENYKKALKDFSLFLQHHPGDAETLRLRGKCYLALGDFEKALSDLETPSPLAGPLEEAMSSQASIRANDDDSLDYPDWLQALVLMYVARLNAEQGQYERAAKFCDSALCRSPVFPECMSLRANILMQQNRLYESEELYRQAVSLRPRDWHMWLGYAHVLQKQIKYAQSLNAIEQALALIKTPPYQEPGLNKRIEIMTRTRDYLRDKTNYHKS